MAHRVISTLFAAALLMTHADSATAQTRPSPFATPSASRRRRRTTSRSRPRCPPSGAPDVELMMAVWTPGSYLVREYERNVEASRPSAPDGRALAVEKSDKNRWRVTTGGAPSVTVKYRVYGREMSVRTNWIEAGFALLNGAPTFLTLADRAPRPHEVVIAPAAGWAKSMTGAARDAGRAAPLPRARLRHAGRFADRDRQPGRLRVHGGRQEALPGERGRGRRVRRRARGQGSRGHRARAPAHVGQPALRQVPVPEPADRERAAASSTRTPRC